MSYAIRALKLVAPLLTRRSVLIKTKLGVLAMSAVLCANSTANALPYYVQTSVSTVGGGAVSNPYSFGSETGQVQATFLPPHVVSGSDSGSTYSISSEATAVAQIGALHTSAVFFVASSTSSGLTSNAQANALWSDTITIESATLAVGTPVTFEATMTFHRTISMVGLGTYLTLATGPFGLLIEDKTTHPNAAQSASILVNALVGDTFLLTSGLSATVIDGLQSNQPASGLVDATNVFTFVPITPGASYSTASGVTFVPEPSTYALAAIGVAALLVARRRSAAIQLR